MRDKCFRCGSDLALDEAYEDENGVTRVLYCPHCGDRYTVEECPEEEKDDYPYYHIKKAR